MKRRKIAIFTGNRAEYGLQYPIIKAIAADPRLEYDLLVSGAHLKENFGRTVKEIEKDGFHVDAQIKIDMTQDTLFATAQAIGSGILHLSPVLAKIKPDFLLVYADRFESFSATITGTQMAIPTAHVEGGDYTEGGALDDSVRHAMTKLAHLHFTTNEQASRRIRQMGEEPWRVKTVGFPALDLVADGLYASPEDVASRYHLDLKRPILLFTQHSITTEFEDAARQVRPALAALEKARRDLDCQIIITYPNDDAGGQRIVKEIEALGRKKLPGIQIHKSLGRYNYHGVLNAGAICMGNSSSGIKETPAFHVPCINIGDRQKGRLRGNNVIDVGYDERQILRAIHRCLRDTAFKKRVREGKNPYGAGHAGRKIADVLATIPINRKLLQKKMTY